MLIFSGEEFKALSAAHPSRLLVLEASFTWCRPCKGFQRAYEVGLDFKTTGGRCREQGESGTASLFCLQLTARGCRHDGRCTCAENVHACTSDSSICGCAYRLWAAAP